MATAISAKEVSELRQRTGAGMMECKKALEETNGDVEKAIDYLRKKGIAKAEKRMGREATEGIVGSYIHHNGKVGVLVEVNCETDFVARTDDFKNLVKHIAEHVAATAPLAVDREGISPELVERERQIAEEQVKASGKPAHIVPKILEGKMEAFFKDNTLIGQPWVRDDKKTVGDLIKETSGKVGEAIKVRRFVRFQLGE